MAFQVFQQTPKQNDKAREACRKEKRNAAAMDVNNEEEQHQQGL